MSKTSKFAVLNDEDEEFTSVKQYLSSCLLHQGKLAEVKMVKIVNSDLTMRFEKRAQKMIKLVGWTNVKHLSGDNSDLSVLGTRGFVVSKGNTGLDFSVGNIKSVSKVQRYENNAHSRGSSSPGTSSTEHHEPEHTFIYSDVAVGRAFVRDSDFQTAPMPQGYDSFYMPQHKLDMDGDGEFDLFEYQMAASFDNRDPAEYEHKYFVKDMSQVNPRYIIKFKFASQEPAISATEKTGPRKKLPTSNLDDCTHFDPENQKPVTMRQKMKMAGAKLLIPIDAAYEQALEDWKREDPLIKGKKSWLEAQLDDVDEKVRAVNLNYADILEKINESAAAATATLQALTKKKLDVLLSAEVELRRQKEQMLWMEGLVAKNFGYVSKKIDSAAKITNSVSDVDADGEIGNGINEHDIREAQTGVIDGQLEFLSMWKHHLQFRNASTRLKPRSHLDALNTVKPDLAVRTELQVYTDSERHSSETPSTTKHQKHHMDAHGLGQSDVSTEELKSAADSMMKESNYLEPVKPSHDLISNLLQSVVDVEASRIHEALTEIVTDGKVPLPRSLHRPASAGKHYASKQLLEILTPPVVKVNELEAINHKELYYGSMKGILGHAPAGAKELQTQKHHHRKGHRNRDSDSGDGEAKNAAKSHDQANMGDREAKRIAEEAQKLVEREHRDRLELMQRQQEEVLMRQQQQAKLAHETRIKEQLAQQKKMLKEEQKKKKDPFARRAQDSASIASSVPTSVDTASRQSTSMFLTRPGMSQMKATTPGRNAAPESLHATDRPETDVISLSDLVNNNHPDPPRKFRSEMMNNIFYPKDVLYKLARKFHAAFSLHALSIRRVEQLRTEVSRQAASDAIEELALSELLDLEDAQLLYYNLPFFSKPPSVRILYSSAESTGDGSQVRLSDLYTKCMKSEKPSVLIIKSGEFTFGAYLSHPIRVQQSGWSGAPSCFIFSATLDLKFPYHARNPPADLNENKPVGFKAERETLRIGNGDLVIHDGGMCETHTENCYGIGLTYGSSEADCILAGTTEFQIEELEVWAVG